MVTKFIKMKKLKHNIFTMLFLSSIISSCTYESESNPGIETDPDLGKSLKERVEKDPSIIKRNDTIPPDKFTFTNTVFYSATKDSLILHSIDFISTNEEKVLVKFSNGELAIASYAEDNVYKSSDYKISIIGNDKIEVRKKYADKKIIFQGSSKR